MSLEQQQLKDELGEFAAQYGPVVIVAAIVTAINDDDTIAVDFSDGVIIDDVRMKAVVKDGNKFLLIPKVGSNVLLGKIRNSDEYVLLTVHDISDVVAVVEDVNCHITQDGFLIKKGGDTLKDALVTFIEAVEAIVVIEGRNVDRVKLATAKTKIQNILQ